MHSVIDFRTIEPRFQNGLIFSLFEGLLPGQSIQVLAAEDPIELYHQVTEANLKNCTWTYLKKGSDIWEIEIRKGTEESR